MLFAILIDLQMTLKGHGMPLDARKRAAVTVYTSNCELLLEISRESVNQSTENIESS